MADLRLTVGGASYGGWKSIAVTRGIEQIAGGYDLSVSELAPDGSAAAALMPGQRAALSIDDQVLITGYIDETEIKHAGSDHSIAVRGRDATGDLVDCAAAHPTGQWLNRNMLQIATDLVAPFGIAVAADTSVGAPFRKWNIEPGETVFENLDRMARHRGVLLFSDGKGGLLITKVGTARVGTALVLGENILAGQVTLSHLSRFSAYTVKGQRPRDDESDGEDVSQKKGVAADAGVTRYRPSVEVIEDVGDADVFTQRATWRRNVNAGRSARATITVQGWAHKDGLWMPNTLVSVTNPWLRLKERELLIVQVRNMLDGAGTRTELSLTLPEAFSLLALPEPDDEDSL